MKEECFFVNNDKNELLYCCLYEPKQQCFLNEGIVIVQPIGHERLRSYREIVTLSRQLSSFGYYVIRFDYRGEGESDGNFENSDIYSRVNDIIFATHHLINNCHINKIHLISFRIGSLLSIMASYSYNYEKIILCDPVLNVDRYIKNLIRAHIINVKDYFKISKINSNDVVEKLENNMAFSVYGFYYTLNFYKQILDISVNFNLKTNFLADKIFVLFFGKNKKYFYENSDADLKHFFLKTNKIVCIDDFVTNFSWGTKKNWTNEFKGLSLKIKEILL